MKVLCLGNNTDDTDSRARDLCDSDFRGLLSELHAPLSPKDYELPGWYHSSVYDIEVGRLIKLAESFDLVLMLDQPVESWSHPDAFNNTVRLIKRLGSKAKCIDESLISGINFFENLVQQNDSFCIYPFIELLINHGFTRVCCRSETPITRLDRLTDYSTDPEYTKLRSKLLAGEKIPHCTYCYDLESQGIPSARQKDTVDWANRLGLNHTSQLSSIKKPVYFEVRASNKCNLQCRMCSPQDSHLIDREYRKIGLISRDTPKTDKNTTGFDIVDFYTAKKIYIAGGEPTIMPEFYDFLDRCIREQQTHKEILINTNGMKLSSKFKSQLVHFTNLNFIFSIDGFGKLNHYIRWPSEWEKITSNWRYLKDRGHKVSVNTTVSIYNINRLHELFFWIDANFPGTLIHVAQAYGQPFSAWLHPDRDAVIDNLKKIRDQQCYRIDQQFADNIEGYIDIMTKRSIPPDLGDFFLFNDKLDRSRDIRLADYCPDIEQARPNNI